jgi:hypothetical protein
VNAGTFDPATAQPISSEPAAPGFINLLQNPIGDQTITQPAGTSLAFDGAMDFTDAIITGFGAAVLPGGNNNFTGTNNFAGLTGIKNLSHVYYADQFSGATVATQINNAMAACPAYSSTDSDNGCIVVIPQTLACGEPNEAADNVLLEDLRNCHQEQGLRFNLSALVTTNVRSKMYLQDNFDSSTTGMTGGKSSATLYVQSFADNPQVTDGTLAAINGTTNINSQTGTFNGALVGGEFETTGNATNGSAMTVADMRGILGNGSIGGNTSATRFVSVYAQNPENTGSGTISKLYNVFAEDPSAVSGVGDSASVYALGNYRGDKSFDFKEIPSPGNPASGYQRMYADSSTHRFTCLSSSGANCSPVVVQSCGTTSTCSHSGVTGVKIVIGSVPLVSGTPSTVTVTGISPAFTSASSYSCTATNATTAADGVKVVNASASSITITGPNTVTDTVNYQCIGS